MIAVDAMGGDHAPHAIVRGVIVAARSGIPILLCGNQAILAGVLQDCAADWRSLPITIEPCLQTITMDEEPSWAVRRKPDASLVRAMRAVADGRAQAFVSAGNSGAVLVAGVMLSGRVMGIARPAIGSFLPTRKGSIFCLDLGANIDCNAELLYQFGLMGHAYVKAVSGNENPRVALLSNGHEPYKGSSAVKRAYDYFGSSTLNFVGNVEARDMFDDRADILVCDGFVGNVMLKTIQGTARTLFAWLKDESERRSIVHRILLWLNEGVFRAIKQRTDYASVGGALLLGVNHPVILAHGSSDARAIANAITFAQKVADEKRVMRFNEVLQASLFENSTLAHALADSFAMSARLPH